jgi:hypothetical protein
MVMQSPNITLNGSRQHWVKLQPEPPGQFTAQVVGIPELRATAATREDALQQVRTLLSDWLASGRLVSVQVPDDNLLLHFQGHLDPSDPLEQEFLAELDRLRGEDREYTFS